MVPGYLFGSAPAGGQITNASCYRNYGTWVPFSQASGGRIWHLGGIQSLTEESHLCDMRPLHTAHLTHLTGAMAPGYLFDSALGGRQITFGTWVLF